MPTRETATADRLEAIRPLVTITLGTLVLSRFVTSRLVRAVVVVSLSTKPPTRDMDCAGTATGGALGHTSMQLTRSMRSVGVRNTKPLPSLLLGPTPSAVFIFQLRLVAPAAVVSNKRWLVARVRDASPGGEPEPGPADPPLLDALNAAAPPWAVPSCDAPDSLLGKYLLMQSAATARNLKLPAKG
jgi:hypothetical protein